MRLDSSLDEVVEEVFKPGGHRAPRWYSAFKDQEGRIEIAPSKIHGRGAFAKGNFLQHVVIAQYVGERIKSRFLNDRETEYLKRGIKSTYLFRINKTEAIDATDPKYDKRKAKFINHHCEPNIEAITVDIDGSKIIILYTLRKVARGEEFVMKYFMETKEDCNCGSREYKASTEDALFAETFKTDDTVSACLSFYSRPAPRIPRIEEIYTLFTLGYRLNGYPARAHGGVVAALIDEVMGILISVNKKLGFVATQADTVTAHLSVTYLKPVETTTLNPNFRCRRLRKVQKTSNKECSIDGYNVYDGDGAIIPTDLYYPPNGVEKSGCSRVSQKTLITDDW